MISKLETWRVEIFCLLISVILVTIVWMQALIIQIQERGIPDFGIMQLELPKDEAALNSLIVELHDTSSVSLMQTNLFVDFAFMPAVYGCVAFWLWLLRKRVDVRLKPILLIMSLMQIIPWILDIIENNLLLGAIRNPNYALEIDIYYFKIMVILKFLIACLGIGTALVICISHAVNGKYFHSEFNGQM